MTLRSERPSPLGVWAEEATPEHKRELDEVFSLVYEELRRLASYLRQGNPNTTLSSTALVHEAWLKLRHSPTVASFSDAHFKGVAAKAMRQVLVDAARRRGSRKRGGAGEAILVTIDAPLDDLVASTAPSSDIQVLALDDALHKLADLNPRQARMMECRFFVGLNVEETAAALGISKSVVERDCRAATAWLKVEIRRELES